MHLFLVKTKPTSKKRNLDGCTDTCAKSTYKCRLMKSNVKYYFYDEFYVRIHTWFSTSYFLG